MARSQFPPTKAGGGAETGQQQHRLSPFSHMMTLEVEGWVVYGSTHYRMIASRRCPPPCSFQSLPSGFFFFFLKPTLLAIVIPALCLPQGQKIVWGLIMIKPSHSWSQARKLLFTLLPFC